MSKREETQYIVTDRPNLNYEQEYYKKLAGKLRHKEKG